MLEPMIQVACLLLAAGQSRRMEGPNKLLLELGDQSVLQHVVREISRSHFSEIIAVTGFQSSLVSAELSSSGIRSVENSAYATGMHSSIRRGLEEIGESADFFAVCLGDQPFLTTADFTNLIEVAHTHTDEKLIAPVIAGTRGQPTLISMSLREEILSHVDDDRGCHYLFAKYPPLLVDLTQSASAFAFHDVDTPAAFKQAQVLFAGDAV